METRNVNEKKKIKATQYKGAKIDSACTTKAFYG